MFRIAICDKDRETHHLLKAYFLRFSIHYDFVFKLYNYDTGEDLLSHYQVCGPHFYHCIFMDVKLQQQNGLVVARQIRAVPDLKVKIIFLTHSSQYVWDSFDVQTFQYLLKPISYEHFAPKILKLCHFLTATEQFLTIKTHQDYCTLPTAEIIGLLKIKHSVQQNKILFFTTCTKSPVLGSGTLTHYLAHLDKSFFLIHRSMVVNLVHVRNFSATTVLMSNQQKYPIGRSRAKKFKKLVTKFTNRKEGI